MTLKNQADELPGCLCSHPLPGRALAAAPAAPRGRQQENSGLSLVMEQHWHGSGGQDPACWASCSSPPLDEELGMLKEVLGMPEEAGDA